MSPLGDVGYNTFGSELGGDGIKSTDSTSSCVAQSTVVSGGTNTNGSNVAEQGVSLSPPSELDEFDVTMTTAAVTTEGTVSEGSSSSSHSNVNGPVDDVVHNADGLGGQVVGSRGGFTGGTAARTGGGGGSGIRTTSATTAALTAPPVNGGAPINLSQLAAQSKPANGGDDVRDTGYEKDGIFAVVNGNKRASAVVHTAAMSSTERRESECRLASMQSGPPTFHSGLGGGVNASLLGEAGGLEGTSSFKPVEMTEKTVSDVLCRRLLLCHMSMLKQAQKKRTSYQCRPLIRAHGALVEAPIVIRPCPRHTFNADILQVARERTLGSKSPCKTLHPS